MPLIIYNDLPDAQKVTKEQMLKQKWPGRTQIAKMFSGEGCKAAVPYGHCKDGLQMYKPCALTPVPGEQLCKQHLKAQERGIEYIDCPALKDVKGVQNFKTEFCKIICKYWTYDERCSYEEVECE